MKTHRFFWIIVILVGLVIIGSMPYIASAQVRPKAQILSQFVEGQKAANTPSPTFTPASADYPTPEARVLPPVGSNAGLVLGASVLVLIIVGAVLGVRLREKH
ncbi:MAG: hypothetical protein WAV05_06405 [Anaerolineales bacterium]